MWAAQGEVCFKISTWFLGGQPKKSGLSKKLSTWFKDGPLIFFSKKFQQYLILVPILNSIANFERTLPQKGLINF